MNKYLLITTTFNNEQEAKKLIDFLLSKRLVSCCQLSTVNSTYRWQGKIVSEPEYLLQMKSKKALFKEIERIIKANHSYETPQIVAYDITAGSQEYLAWIDQETI